MFLDYVFTEFNYCSKGLKSFVFGTCMCILYILLGVTYCKVGVYLLKVTGAQEIRDVVLSLRVLGVS